MQGRMPYALNKKITMKNIITYIKYYLLPFIAYLLPLTSYLSKILQFQIFVVLLRPKNKSVV